MTTHYIYTYGTINSRHNVPHIVRTQTHKHDVYQTFTKDIVHTLMCKNGRSVKRTQTSLMCTSAYTFRTSTKENVFSSTHYISDSKCHCVCILLAGVKQEREKYTHAPNLLMVRICKESYPQV